MSILDPLKALLGIKPAVTYPHVERLLALSYGLSHDTFKAVRAEKLERGPDWELVNQLVSYSDTGRAKALTALKIAPEAPPPTPPPVPPADQTPPDSAPNDPPPPPAPGAVEMEVIRTVRNRHLVLALHGKVQVWVWVKSSENFIPGMKFHARQAEGGRWELEGRCPRWRGKF